MKRIDHSWSERRSTTLRDVAQVVGVSESTVSVVLNRTRSGTRVSANTRRNVLEAAERLGYWPNALARSLQTGQTHRIGFYSGRAKLDARNLFYAELLSGICEGANEQGTNVLLHTNGDEPDMLLDLVSNRAIDGLVIHPGADDPIVPMLGQLRIPAIAVADPVEMLPSVCVDDHAGGVMQAKHLYSLGHKVILYKQTGMTAQSAVLRMEAFIATAAELGMDVIVHHDELLDDGLLSRDLAILTRPKSPATAIVGWNEFRAEQVCRHLCDLGIPIPAGVAVVGFDGFRRFYDPRFELTTIRAPWAEVGRVAVRVLYDLIAGKEVPYLNTLPVEFVRGATT
jgi:LacI family transcriptional regulator